MKVRGMMSNMELSEAKRNRERQNFIRPSTTEPLKVKELEDKYRRKS